MEDAEWEEMVRGAVKLWTEDDAAPDAEHRAAAHERIFGHTNPELLKTRLVWSKDYGDCETRVYDLWLSYYVIHECSYRGNNAILVANKKGK